jgi:hypothetical protein
MAATTDVKQSNQQVALSHTKMTSRGVEQASLRSHLLVAAAFNELLNGECSPRRPQRMGGEQAVHDAYLIRNDQAEA